MIVVSRLIVRRKLDSIFDSREFVSARFFIASGGPKTIVRHGS